MNAEIERIRDAIAHYEEDSEYADSGITKESLTETLARCEEVYGDLRIEEMTALWYLRHIYGERNRMTGVYCWLLPTVEEWYKEMQAKQERRERGEPEEESNAFKTFYEECFENGSAPVKERLATLAAYLNGQADGLEIEAKERTGNEQRGLQIISGTIRVIIQSITKEAEKL